MAYRWNRYLLISGAVILLVSQCQAQDPVAECLATIAQGGLFKTVKETTGQHTYSSVKDWFCSQDFLNSAQSSTTSVGIQTPWGGGTFNASDQSQLAQRQTFCQDNTKNFDDQEQSYLVLKEGDHVIAQDLQTCIVNATISAPYLSPVVNPYPDGTFDLLLSARAYPGKNPLVVSQTVLGGATPVDVSEIYAGARIPFQSSGTAPITATYKFEAGMPMARVKVTTSIGSATVVAVQCPAGKIGSWEVDQDAHQTVQTPLAPFSDSRGVPAASCNPHCHLGQGDPIPFDFTVPSDIILSSVTAHLNGGGAVFDGTTVTQPHPYQIHVIVESRSNPTTVVVNANQTKVSTQTIRQKVDSGDIIAGHVFTLALPNGSNATAVIKDTSGTATMLTAAELQADNSIPDWLKLTSVPQQSGNTLLVNLMSSGPSSCTVP